MSVEVILVENRVVVGERLGETGQARGRDLLQRRLVRLVTDSADVDRYAVLSVTHRLVNDSPTTYTAKAEIRPHHINLHLVTAQAAPQHPSSISAQCYQNTYTNSGIRRQAG